MNYEIAAEWVHVQYAERSQFTEVYGFSGTQGMVNCEGLRYVPKGKPSKTLAVYMHPSSTLQLLPMPAAMARAGVHVLCAGSRFAKNDTPLVMEKVVLDLGATIGADAGHLVNLAAMGSAMAGALYGLARPTVGLILGSGLGSFADSLSERTVVPYERLPGFPPSTIVGHAGQLVHGREIQAFVKVGL